MTTHELTAQDLAQPAPRWSLERRLTLLLALLIGAFALSFTGPLLSRVLLPGAATAPVRAPASLPAIGPIDAISVDDKAQIVVEGQDAQAGNAAIPFLGLPLGKVQAFGLNAARAETYATALKCLTQAVYYEAAVEPLQGRRAVAQVVLNRMRHPSYPKSVCGVVYQGAQRTTGCQFSFTCDGSLLRAPSAGAWREASEVARAALAGYVEPSVGTATFYHADYVLPKWAYQLGKITQIGRHLFYRFNGGMGSVAAFNGRYAGTEAIPALDLAALKLRAIEGDLALAEPAEAHVTGLTVTPHVTDRHAENDVGGRIDMTKGWRPSLPDPLAMTSRYRQVVAESSGADAVAAAAPPAAPAMASTAQ